MFNLFKKVLGKTNDAIKDVAPTKRKIIPKEEFEDILLEADVHYDLVERLLEGLPEKINKIQAFNSLISVFQYKADFKESDDKPFVEMIIGVNGAGKTTTISKLAYRYQQEGKKVILGAGDTFRAAAIEQLTRWADKLNIPIIATQQGHDPSAVVFDTIASAKAKDFDNIIIDTAGRLHVDDDLMTELEEIRELTKPSEVLLVSDAMTGQDAVNSAAEFNRRMDLTGIIMTKMDGDARGGAALSIRSVTGTPIKFVGTGEK